MSAFVVIQVGQCGNQVGHCLLPEILREYDIKINNEVSRTSKRDKIVLQQFIDSFFHINSSHSTFDTVNDLVKCKAKARFVCIDMEESVVSRFKSGKFRDLLDQRCLITNYPGSGNNWAEGYYNHGPKYKQKILKAIQYTIEKCDKLHGFLLVFSVGGGTGSGLGTFILSLLEDYYPKTERFVVCVYPTGTEDVITGPYNMGFATQELVDSATCVFPVENRSLFDITLRQSNCNRNAAPLGKPFDDMNNIIVDLILHLTSGSRFGGKMNIDINDINTNMIPFPKLNFLTSGFSDLSLQNSKCTNSHHLKTQSFLASCSRSNQLIKVDPFDSRYTAMSVTLLGRGCYSMNDMRTYLDKLKSKLYFASWSNKALKVGLCDVAPKGLDYSMLTLYNTSAISNLFQENLQQFTKLYQRKAYTHHYAAISGFDYISFEECQNSLHNVIQFYKEIDHMRIRY